MMCSLPLRIALLWVAFHLIGKVGPAQKRPLNQPDQPLIRVNVDLVQFDVVVTDSKGNRVGDIRAEEFKVFENGKPQRITNLSFVPGVKSITTVDSRTRQSTPVAPTSIRREQVARTVAIVIDDLGLSDQSFMQVRRGLEGFIDDRVQASDLIAMITTSGRLGALQRLTADKRILRAAVARLFSAPHHRAGVLDDDFCGNQDRDDYYSRMSIAAIRRVVDSLRELPGRRSMLLFSEGMPMAMLPQARAQFRTPLCGAGHWNQALIDEYNAFVVHANRSGVAINTVDPRGMIATFETAERASLEDAKPRERATALAATQGQLSDMAQRTGGLAIAESNDLPGAITRVMSHETGYYLIAYKPEGRTSKAPKASPRFRDIAVLVTRPGLKARFHSSLYEDEPKQPGSAAQRIARAAMSPFVDANIRIRLASRFWDFGKEGGPVLVTGLHINAGDLEFTTETDGRRKAVFDITAVILGAESKPLESLDKSYTVSLTDSGYQKALANGLVQRLQLPLKRPGAYQIRCAVWDRQKDRIGSASEFIEVPVLRPGALALSGIVLRTDGVQSEAAPADTYGDYHRGETIFYAYQVLNAQADASGLTRVQVRCTLYRDRKALGSSLPVIVDGKGQLDARRLVATGDFRLGEKLPPGIYTLEVSADDLNSQAKRASATQTVDFEIVE